MDGGVHLMTWLAALTGSACLLLIVQIGLLWRNLNVSRTLQRAQARMGHLGDALALLTETSESGFRTMASEIERLTESAGRVREPPVDVPRLAAAARRGRSAAQIAAAENLSEGEVSLRLHLAEHRQQRTDGRRKPRIPKGPIDGAMRAD
jgi:hypothetical protein